MSSSSCSRLVALAIGAVRPGRSDEPRQSHLGRGGAMLGRDLVERLQDTLAALVQVLAHAGPARAFPELLAQPGLPGQESTGKRVVADDADPLLTA